VKRKPLNEDFHALWNKIKRRTRYAVEYQTTDLVAQAVTVFKTMPAIEQPKIVTKRASIGVDDYGLTHKVLMVRDAELEYQANPIPDVLAYLQRETHLTRTTIAEFLVQSGRLSEVRKNPQQFLDQAVTAIRKTLEKLMIQGIKYELLTGDGAEFPTLGTGSGEGFAREFEAYEQRLIDVDKSIYEAVEFDSEIERVFAEALDAREDIRLFIKLPSWFKVPTPVGNYNPDWAIVLRKDETVYLVRETKGSHDLDTLLPSQAAKVRCGTVHFTHLGVDFAIAKSADEVR
jgi:type III restriction enzyme